MLSLSLKFNTIIRICLLIVSSQHIFPRIGLRCPDSILPWFRKIVFVLSLKILSVGFIESFNILLAWLLLLLSLLFSQSIS